MTIKILLCRDRYKCVCDALFPNSIVLVAIPSRMLKNGFAQLAVTRIGVFLGVTPVLVSYGMSEALIFGLQTHFSLDLGGLKHGGQQVPHAHQVVSSGRKAENPSHSQPSSMSRLA